MTKKRKCQHQCMARPKKNGPQCKNKVLLHDSGNHLVIEFQNQWATLCHVHFQQVFNYVIQSGPVATNEAYCPLTFEQFAEIS